MTVNSFGLINFRRMSVQLLRENVLNVNKMISITLYNETNIV